METVKAVVFGFTVVHIDPSATTQTAFSFAYLDKIVDLLRKKLSHVGIALTAAQEAR